MKYNKGDIIKFVDGRIALVLKAGLSYDEIHELYPDKQCTLSWIWPQIPEDRFLYPGIPLLGKLSIRAIKTDKISEKQYKYYQVMMGDKIYWTIAKNLNVILVDL